MDVIKPESISSFFNEPENEAEFNIWIEQSDICQFLEIEIQDQHIILYASLPNAFINSVLIPSVKFNKRNIQDLLKWDIAPHSSWSEVYSSEKVWLEPPLSSSGSKIISKGEQIIFSRHFDGAISNRNYYELAQKLTQILEIHFVPERNAWCKIDEFGDIEDLVKITEFEAKSIWEAGTIISMQRNALERYTTLTDSTLLRMFDFTRFRSGSFNGWGNGTKKSVDGDNIFGRLVVQSGYGSYARGIQIADIRFDKQELIDEMWGRSSAKGNDFGKLYWLISAV